MLTETHYKKVRDFLDSQQEPQHQADFLITNAHAAGKITKVTAAAARAKASAGQIRSSALGGSASNRAAGGRQ